MIGYQIKAHLGCADSVECIAKLGRRKRKHARRVDGTLNFSTKKLPSAEASGECLDSTVSPPADSEVDFTRRTTRWNIEQRTVSDAKSNPTFSNECSEDSGQGYITRGISPSGQDTRIHCRLGGKNRD